MPYTVKQVARLSGVSVRTLHFYDETGLLHPAYIGPTGYRFYEEPQLLMLQQILFYRELGFELKQIRQILDQPDFEKIAALESHRQTLQQTLARTHQLIQTIDKTIQHLKGELKMKTEELFAGFSVAAGDDRFGEHIQLGGPGGPPSDCKVSAQDTNGALCIFEGTGEQGGPKHLHFEQDEWIYILDGQFEFLVGNKQFRLGPGESIFIPRKTPHVWGCISGRPGKILNAYQPAGKMEDFWREVGNPLNMGKIFPTLEQMQNKTYTKAQVEAMHKFFAEYGMDLLGPPLGFEM
jgi:DNA-binding transcriptional MerR regulator/quercetin dioxygenase-like cupin family protein